MMIPLTHLPEDLAVPVCLHGSSAFKRPLPQKALIRDLPVVKDSALLGEVTIQARGIWHLPGMHDCAVEIDQVDHSLARRKHCQPGRSSINIKNTQAGTPAPDRILVDSI